jgi:hypothetical protein
MTLGWSAPSEDELEAGGDFTTLPEDEYIAVVRDISIKQNVVNNFPSKNDPDPLHDMIVVRMDALTFADGETLEDTEGKPVEGAVSFQTYLNPKKVGMIPRPSNTRKFFAAVLGQALGDPIRVDDFSTLVGKQLIVSLKPNKGYNNPQDYRAIKRSRSRGTTPKGPVEGAELEKRAKEVFDEDSPTNVSTLPATSKGDDDDLDF